MEFKDCRAEYYLRGQIITITITTTTSLRAWNLTCCPFGLVPGSSRLLFNRTNNEFLAPWACCRWININSARAVAESLGFSFEIYMFYSLARAALRPNSGSENTHGRKFNYFSGSSQTWMFCATVRRAFENFPVNYSRLRR